MWLGLIHSAEGGREKAEVPEQEGILPPACGIEAPWNRSPARDAMLLACPAHFQTHDRQQY